MEITAIHAAAASPSIGHWSASLSSSQALQPSLKFQRLSLVNWLCSPNENCESMTGIILMSAFLAAVAVLGGVAYVITRLLPEGSLVRKNVEAAVTWITQNPRLFERRLKQVAFGLLVLMFVLLTIIYS